jgi:hypothetical protein
MRSFAGSGRSRQRATRGELALRRRRNMLIHRDRVKHAKLIQSPASGAGGDDDLVGGLLT